jgi:signal peptide peptidase SppA
VKHKFNGRGDLAINPEAVGLTWARAPREDSIRGGVAVISIHGPLEHRGGWWFDSYESILGRIKGAMESDDVHAVLLDIDSPGGEVSGLQETVRSIRKMRAEHDKPIIAFADDDAYSAAYALACSADEIYLPEGGGVGSVGVIAEVQNLIGMAEKQGVKVAVVRSGTRKADGHPFLPLDEGTISRVQKRVDALAQQFFSLVRDVRPISKADLVALQGACVFGKAAVRAGLADGVLSFDEVLAGISDGTDGRNDSPDFGAKGRNEAPLDTSYGSGITSDHAHHSGDAMNFKALEKKVAVCLAALNGATTPSARKKASAAYGAAVQALTEAKVKKTYEKKTTETETEEDDGEKDPPSGDDDEPDGDEDEEEETASDEDEAKSKKGKKATTAMAPGLSLEAFALALTGQSDPKAAAEVLASMHETAQLAASSAQKIAKLEATAKAAKLSAMIKEGMSAGKIKPAQLAWARTQSTASLKAYLDATPASFAPRSLDPSGGHSEDASEEAPSAADGLTDFERKLCAEQGITIEVYKKQRASNGAPTIPKVN